MRRVLIIGAGGHGRVVHEILSHAANIVEQGFIWCDGHKSHDPWGRLRCVRPDTPCVDASAYIVAIGDNRAREEMTAAPAATGMTIIRAVHHTTSVLGDAFVSKRGTVICAHAVVGVDSVVRDGAIINTAATVDHECRIGAFAHICPGVHLAGHVMVGNYATIGTGAVVIPGVSVGEGSYVGAGAVVIGDVQPYSMVVGNPARHIRWLDP